MCGLVSLDSKLITHIAHTLHYVYFIPIACTMRIHVRLQNFSSKYSVSQKSTPPPKKTCCCDIFSLSTCVFYIFSVATQPYACVHQFWTIYVNILWYHLH